jgi:hypothetical protein
MANINATIRAKIVTPASPTIYNVPVVIADEEYYQDFSPSTKKFTIRSRQNAVLKVAFSIGETGTNYITIPRGMTYCEDGIDFSGTVFFRSDTPDIIVEVLEWT